MTKKKRSKKPVSDDRVAEILGAYRVVPLEGLPAQGPLDLLALRRAVQERLQSSGGRPTDPSWSITRSIRFRPEHWQQLEQLARLVSDGSRKVGPGQLAAILLDRAISGLQKRLEGKT